MFSKIALYIRWHSEKHIEEVGTMRHPADTPAWKKLDKQYPQFVADSCNVRLALASDGFNPFGHMSNSYSMWPIFLVPYNLPPYVFKKEPFHFMLLLIPDPCSAGNDIDIYIRPLMAELKQLEDEGMETYDSYSGKRF